MGEGSPTPDELMRSAKESLQAEAGATPVETSATVRDGCNMWQASATLPGDGGDKVFLVGLLFCPQGRLFLIGGWAIPAQKGVLDAFVESFHPLPASD